MQQITRLIFQLVPRIWAAWNARQRQYLLLLFVCCAGVEGVLIKFYSVPTLRPRTAAYRNLYPTGAYKLLYVPLYNACCREERAERAWVRIWRTAVGLCITMYLICISYMCVTVSAQLVVWNLNLPHLPLVCGKFKFQTTNSKPPTTSKPLHNITNTCIHYGALFSVLNEDAMTKNTLLETWIQLLWLCWCYTRMQK